jgi:hypothetical protein
MVVEVHLQPSYKIPFAILEIKKSLADFYNSMIAENLSQMKKLVGSVFH